MDALSWLTVNLQSNGHLWFCQTEPRVRACCFISLIICTLTPFVCPPGRCPAHRPMSTSPLITFERATERPTHSSSSLHWLLSHKRHFVFMGAAYKFHRLLHVLSWLWWWLTLLFTELVTFKHRGATLWKCSLLLNRLTSEHWKSIQLVGQRFPLKSSDPLNHLVHMKQEGA